MKSILAVLITLSLAVSAWAQPSMPEGTRFDEKSNGIDQKLAESVALDTRWKDENGKDIVLSEYFNDGKSVMLVPIFYECQGSCVLVLDGVIQGLNAFKKEPIGQGYKVVVFSINPKEGPESGMRRKEEVQNVYRFKKVGSNDLHFLTGKIEDITELTTSLGFRYTYNPYTGRINHPAGIMIATPEGKISQYFYGTEYQPSMLHKALGQARTEKIGAKAQVVLFGCFSYDPHTKQWSMNVRNSLKFGGILTVIALFSTIFILSRKSKASNSSVGGADPS
jgi:protein SCO1